jgi:hypothetical protein
MVEPRVLDDFKQGDWVGINYQEPQNDYYSFPTIVKSVNNRNPNSLDDHVEVVMTPPGCPLQLKREYIHRIWRTVEASH